MDTGISNSLAWRIMRGKQSSLHKKYFDCVYIASVAWIKYMYNCNNFVSTAVLKLFPCFLGTDFLLDILILLYDNQCN